MRSPPEAYLGVSEENVREQPLKDKLNFFIYFFIFLTDRFKYRIVKQIFSGGDQTFVLCSTFEVKFSFGYHI